MSGPVKSSTVDNKNGCFYDGAASYDVEDTGRVQDDTMVLAAGELGTRLNEEQNKTDCGDRSLAGVIN